VRGEACALVTVGGFSHSRVMAGMLEALDLEPAWEGLPVWLLHQPQTPGSSGSEAEWVGLIYPRPQAKTSLSW
jgi:hypothetical protein